MPSEEKGRAVESVFWLTAGHVSEPDVWYAGTAPVGLFRSADGGVTWAEVEGFNDRLYQRIKDSVVNIPDGSLSHSILVHPKDPRHLYIGLSTGGVFESTDGGESWVPLNKGIEASFLPDANAEFGHDPHLLAMHPLDPERLYQQNHCGIYRIDRPAVRWERIGDNMPKEIGDIGFPIVLHPRDPDTAWVIPMDGREVWPRTSIGGKPAVYVTRNAGKSWKRQDKGLPKSQAWLTVKRQSFASDAGDPVGLYFGTTSGELWVSRDEGGKWECVAAHLPQIVSIETLAT
jgi:hypothetical protein